MHPPHRLELNMNQKTLKTPKPKVQRRHLNRTCQTCRNWAHFENGNGLCRSIHWLHSGDFWQTAAGDTCLKWSAEVRRKPVALAPRLPIAPPQAEHHDNTAPHD